MIIATQPTGGVGERLWRLPFADAYNRISFQTREAVRYSLVNAAVEHPDRHVRDQ